MDLPKYHETFMPILEVLNTEKYISNKELQISIRNKYYSDLPADLLNKKTNTGVPILFYRIGWGKSYLKIAKFIDCPSYGIAQITEKGRKILKKENLTLENLKNDPDFIAYESVKKSVKITISKKENKIEKTNFENHSPQDLIDLCISEIELEVKIELLDKLKKLNPYYFEEVILKLLAKMGNGELKKTSKSSDGGIDGIMNQDKLGLETIYTQAKRYNEKKV